MKKKKLIKILLRTIFVLLLLELSLWGGGYARNVYAQIQNANILNNNTDYTILIKGDSITYDGREGSWPTQFEQMMINNTQKNFNIINTAQPSHTSTKVLETLEEEIINYDPDMVIVMMGMEDKHIKTFGQERTSSIFDNIKTYKMIKMFIQTWIAKEKIDEKEFQSFEEWTKTINDYLTAEEYFKIGNEHFSVQDWKKSEYLFKKSLEMDNDYFSSYEGLMHTYIHLYENDKSDVMFNALVNNLEADFDTHMMLATKYVILSNSKFPFTGYYKKALYFFNTSHNIRSESIYPMPGLIYSNFKVGNINTSIRLIDELFILNSSFDNTYFMSDIYLVQAHNFYLGGEYELAEESYKKALSFKDSYEIRLGLERLYFDMNLVDDALVNYNILLGMPTDYEYPYEAYAYKAAYHFRVGEDELGEMELEKSKVISDIMIMDTLESSARLLEDNDYDVKAFELYDRANVIRRKSVNPMTIINYNTFYDITKRNGVKLVVVQYPMLPVEDVKSFFESDNNILFISNEYDFKRALEISSYEELFYDRIQIHFGHCTDHGYRMIAENVMNHVLRELES